MLGRLSESITPTSVWMSLRRHSSSKLAMSIVPTPELGTGARLVLIVCMFVGRLGPLTIATLWRYSAQSEWAYSQEGFTIG